MMSVWAVSNLMGISLKVEILFTGMWGRISLTTLSGTFGNIWRNVWWAHMCRKRPGLLLNIPQYTGHSPTTSSLGPAVSIMRLRKPGLSYLFGDMILKGNVKRNARQRSKWGSKTIATMINHKTYLQISVRQLNLSKIEANSSILLQKANLEPCLKCEMYVLKVSNI